MKQDATETAPIDRERSVWRTRPTRCGTAARALPIVLIAVFHFSGTAAAQQAGRVAGTVTAAGDASPIPAATIQLHGEGIGALSNADGTFLIDDVPAGAYTVNASALGYRSASKEITVRSGESVRLTFELHLRPIETEGITVSVLRPDLAPQSTLDDREVQAAYVPDSGELMRLIPGANAGRRGGLGLDPVIRASREDQIGTYVDGARSFTAGPARMDSPLTHVDPTAVSSMEVIKGPYALTWGAGNQTAVRVTTAALPTREVALRGTVLGGFESNTEAGQVAAKLSGRQGSTGYWVHGAWRTGSDYTSGDGTEILSAYDSWEVRGKVGIDVGRHSTLLFNAGYQDQGPIDYEGRLLTAEYFKTFNASGDWTLSSERGTLRKVNVLAYYQSVDHAMSNRNKPTSLPDSTRVPPFALDISLAPETYTIGGRAATTLAVGPGWELETGADIYSNHRNATRTVRNQSTGMVLFEDLVWPDATITDAGLFLRGSRPVGKWLPAAAVRLDITESRADTASDFFLDNVSGDLETSRTFLNGSASVGYNASRNWALFVGIGSVARTPDILEQYSDRFPTTRAQRSFEVVGNPDLKAERSNQLDAWVEASYPAVAVQAAVFYRKMTDYITVEPTDLPKRLPLSPDTVYQFVNGSARFWGFELNGSFGLTTNITLLAGADYTWGQDELNDEPAFGVSPFGASAGLRYEALDKRWYVEGLVRGAAAQNRVNTTVFEATTDGWVTGDIVGGVQVVRGLYARLGITNIWDEQYANHLNARNPFNGQQVPEPGRAAYVNLTVGF